MISIYIEGGDEGLGLAYIATYSPSVHSVAVKSPKVKLEHFNQYCDHESFIGYHIEYDPNGRIFIEHFGASSFYNRKILTWESKDIPKDLKFISISALSKPVAFQDIDIRNSVPINFPSPSNPIIAANLQLPPIVSLGGSLPPVSPNAPASPQQQPQQPQSGSMGMFNIGKKAIKNLKNMLFSSSTPLPSCDNGLTCKQMGDLAHLKEFEHPIAPLCEYGECCEKLYSRSHGQKHQGGHTHPCRFGTQCNEKNDPKHLQTFVHLERSDCPEGRNCKQNTDWKHREEFRHPNLPDFLIPCRDGTSCKNISRADHLIKYKHYEKGSVFAKWASND